MENSHRRDTFLQITAITILGGAIRFAALFNDFWTDEVGSWVIAQNAGSFLEIFSTRDVNNHILNTVFLFIIGGGQHWSVYRLPAFILGTASIALAGMIGAVRSRHTAIITALLFASSFQMTLYSSEARGYGPAIFFSLLCFLLLLKGRPHHTFHALIFAASAMLGLLSHLTFVIVFLGLALAMSIQTLNRKGQWTWKLGLRWFGAPGVLLILLLIDLWRNPLHLGWDIRYTFLHSLKESLTVPVGAPENMFGTLVALLSIVTIVTLGLRRLRGERDPSFFLYLFILLSPLLLLPLGALHRAWGARFIVLPVTFFYLLASSFLANFWERGQWKKVGAMLLMGSFILSNSWNVSKLLTIGRGQYLEAFRKIALETPGEEIHIGSKSFSTYLLLQFYAPYLPRKQYNVHLTEKKESEIPTVFLLKGTEVTLHLDEKEEKPSWFIWEDRYHRFDPGDGVVTLGDTTYALEEVFPYFRESGHDWFLYRSEPPLPLGES